MQPRWPSTEEKIKRCGTYTHSGISLRHKEEWSADTCHNTDELGKHSAEGNQPDAEATEGMIPLM